jgi:hypothetical protein
MGGGGKGKGKGAKVSRFQVQLGGKWEDYSVEEDKILKRAFMSGFKGAKFSLRGQHYEYDLAKNKQINKGTGKVRQIRPPNGWRAPSAPIVRPGKTQNVTVKKGQPGTTLTLKHPDGGFYLVQVPAGAKVGQHMLVPVPDKPDAETKEKAQEKSGGSGWSTGAKVAAGTAAVGVGAAAGVAGVLIAEHGLEGAGEIVADAAEDAGEAIVDGVEDAAEAIGDWVPDAAEAIGEWVPDAAEDAVEWIGDATEDVGDFFMDLF